MTEMIELCPAEGLSYTHDSQPGIRRRRAGRGFTYWEPQGERISDPEILKRIRALGIPPAWTEVWICTDPRGHLQATGRDAKRRKQYLYHPDFRRERDETKYEHLLEFGRSLPLVRAALERHLALPGLPRDKVMATVVHLLQTTLIRIGNAAYARANKSFGLTTLRRAHVSVEASSLRFNFRGKSGRVWRLKVTDRRIASIVRLCQELPGQSLFQYKDEEGKPHEVTSSDVNLYLRSVAGGRGVSAKDFRTWAGTVMMVETLRDTPPPTSATQGKRTLAAALRQVAGRLGNTVAVCRRCYIHPAVTDLYLAGNLAVRRRGEAEGLSEEETATMTILRRWRREQTRRNDDEFQTE